MKNRTFLWFVVISSFMQAMDYIPTTQEVTYRIKLVQNGLLDASCLNQWPGNRYGLLRQLIRRRKDLAEKLLQAGADPNFDDGFNTPLGSADYDGIPLLLQYGADPKRCGCSLLCSAINHYQSKEKDWDDSFMDQTISLMNLCIEKGEDISKWECGNNGRHLLYKIACSGCSTHARQLFIGWAIQHGSDPHDACWKATICNSRPGRSVYAQLHACEKMKAWVQFIGKERSWYLVKSLFAAFYKKQPDDCFVQLLPQELLQIIRFFILQNEIRVYDDEEKAK